MSILSYLPRHILYLLFTIVLHSNLSLTSMAVASDQVTDSPCSNTALPVQDGITAQPMLGRASSEARQPSQATPLTRNQGLGHEVAVTMSEVPAQLEMLPGGDVYLLENVEIPLVACVKDNIGQPVREVPVTFQVTMGSGVLADMQVSTQVSTNEQGEATTSITVPTVLEPTCVVTSVADVAPVTATFTGVPEEALRLIEVSGNNQVGNPGQVLDEPFVVRVEAQFETPAVSLCEELAGPSGPLVTQMQPDSSPKQEPVPHQQSVPVVGVNVMGEIVQGEASFVASRAQTTTQDMAEVVTDVQGEARFFVQIDGTARGDIMARVSALGQEVDFLTAVGFAAPLRVAVEADGYLVMIDIGLESVIRINPVSGNLSLISGPGRGTGPRLPRMEDIAVMADGALFVTDSRLRAVFRIDPITGNRTLVSGCEFCDVSAGTGPSLFFLDNIAVDTDGHLMVTADDMLVRIDPISGNRTLVSGICNTPDTNPSCSASAGTGPPLGVLLAMAVEADGHIVVGDSQSIVRIDPTTGDRTPISGCIRDMSFNCSSFVGNGPSLGVLQGMEVEADGHLVIADSRLEAVLRINPTTGDRTILSGCTRAMGRVCTTLMGIGPPFESPVGIAIETDGSIIVTDISQDAVVRLDPATGDRRIVSQAPSRGSGPSLRQPRAIAVEADGHLMVVDSSLEGIIRIDAITGQRTLVSGCIIDDNFDCVTLVGSGPPLNTPRGLAVELDGDFVVVDSRLGIARVTPTAGDRRIVSGCTERDENFDCVAPIGEGPFLDDPDRIAVEANGHLVVTDSNLDGIVRVNPHTGNRTLLTGCTAREPDFNNCIAFMSSGPPLSAPQGIAVEADGHLVVTDSMAVVRVDPVTGNRTTVSGCIRDERLRCIAVAGKGPELMSVEDVAVEADGHLVVIDTSLEAAVRIDAATGDRTLIAGCVHDEAGNCISFVGNGPPFIFPLGIALETDRRFVVTDFSLKAVLRVDSKTGERTIVSR